MERGDFKDTIFSFMPKGMTMKHCLIDQEIDDLFDEHEKEVKILHNLMVSGERRGINKCEEDFGSRKCQECKHLDTIGICRNKKSHCYDMEMVDNKAIAYFRDIAEQELDEFSCNKFERGRHAT